MLPKSPTNSLKDFYKNQNIFITGGTGFLGKVLVEKILYSCNVKVVYLLIRSKRNVSSEQRYEQYTSDKIFERIKKECPEELSKIVCISGDVSEPNLGVTDSVRDMLLETTNIVFHSAATVRFQERLDISLNINASGTERILKMCTQMKRLKGVVCVSTAFLHPDLDCRLKERVYPLEFANDKYDLIKQVEALPTEELDLLFAKIKGKHFNNYTFTKTISECVIKDYQQKYSLPIAIVRPSTIIGSIDEPEPFYNDNCQTVNGLSLQIHHGALHCVNWKSDSILDTIPVDVVVKTLIGAAWQLHNKTILNEILEEPLTINCTSSEFYNFPISNVICPSRQQLTKPFVFTANRFIYNVITILTLIQLTLVDFLWRILKKRAIHVKLFRRTIMLAELCIPFMTKTWTFDCENFLSLIKEIKDSPNSSGFEIDMNVQMSTEFFDQLLINNPYYNSF